MQSEQEILTNLIIKDKCMILVRQFIKRQLMMTAMLLACSGLSMAQQTEPKQQFEPTPHYRERYQQFEAEPPITRQDLVMLGNSLTEGGGDWGKRLGMKHVVNRGIIGDDVPGITNRLHQILPGQPRVICLLTGANDVSHDLSIDSIAHSIIHLAERILRECPETHLYLQSLLPINESFQRYKRLNGKTSHFAAINRQLQAWVTERHDPRLTFVHLYPLFTESEGSEVLKAELTTDGLHLREEGYHIWTKALKKALK